MPLQRVVDRDPLMDQSLAVIDQQPQVELGAVQMRCGQRVQTFAQCGSGDGERVDAVGLPAPARLAPRRRHQRAVHTQHRVRRARSRTAPASPRHAGSPRSPRRAPRPGRAPSPAALPRPSRPTGPSARRALHPTPQRPRRSCASACGCPHRARSLTSSTSTSTELDSPADTACWGRCHAPIKSRREIPDRRRATQRKPVRPRVADSLKASQLAAGRDLRFGVGRHRRRQSEQQA